jgi:hypothetical protein
MKENASLPTGVIIDDSINVYDNSFENRVKRQAAGNYFIKVYLNHQQLK